MLKSIVFSLAVLAAVPASAQPYRGGPGARAAERAGDRADANRSRAQLQDDRRDLARFQNTLAAYDAAVAARDLNAVRAAMWSFIQQGEAEVNEQRRETWQAAGEANRSAREARRDGTFRDAVNAADDRRDLQNERAELREEWNLLQELKQAHRAQFVWGPQVPILIRARQAMVRFVDLARIEVARTHQELREDRRELREDRRGGPGWRR